MEHLPLPDGADYDDREMVATFPGGEDLTGVRRLRFDVETNFISVMPHQYAASGSSSTGNRSTRCSPRPPSPRRVAVADGA